MNVTTIKENEDGSANIVFDMTPEEADAMLRYGILEALKAAIREGEKLKVDGEDI
jgi:hypothetical protein